MFTKIAIAAAIVLATATGALAATKKQNANDGRGFDQRSNYSSEWSYWHRYDNMGDYN
jgi:hypothetical protein